MSKQYNSHAPDSTVRVIKTMSTEEIEVQYGIEISEDGSVWDPLDLKQFHSLTEWALYLDEVEQQELEAASYRGNCKYAFDDEY